MRISLITRTAAAFIAGIFITFSQAHDANVAMLGLLIISAGWFLSTLFLILENQNRIVNGLIMLATGAIAWLSVSVDANASTAWAWLLLQAWALFAVATELHFANRAAKKSAARRDQVISAALAAALLAAQLLIDPADSVSHVGFFGAYAIILAVHLGISSASPKQA